MSDAMSDDKLVAEGKLVKHHIGSFWGYRRV